MLPDRSVTWTSTLYVPSGAGSVAESDVAYACQADHVAPPLTETRTRLRPLRSSAKEADTEIVGLFVSVAEVDTLPVGRTVSSVSCGIESWTSDMFPYMSNCVAETV